MALQVGATARETHSNEDTFVKECRPDHAYHRGRRLRGWIDNPDGWQKDWIARKANATRVAICSSNSSISWNFERYPSSILVDGGWAQAHVLTGLAMSARGSGLALPVAA
jgi:hypothetical protein